MSIQVQGVVTRRSNGALEIRTAEGQAVERIVVHESALGSKALPAMGDAVTVSIEVTQPVEGQPRADVRSQSLDQGALAGSAVGDVGTGAVTADRTTARAERRKP